MNWREMPVVQVSKEDILGIKKEVKVEVEDGRVLQICDSGSGSSRRRLITGITSSAALSISPTLLAAEERQDGRCEGIHGEQRAHRHCPQGEGSEYFFSKQ
ncbi:17.7 kDa class I heat shock protein [Apostasia shenzhenica]|uniref:17.7 kDa class I heat shock protein n=1 Tax=Apostasia shenzhenica TaxID=1088818 RepID=A0A2I0ATP9_9ASPA|nr:17.7 kDa class I heat shock protein [Apostasia shenzhenica]